MQKTICDLCGKEIDGVFTALFFSDDEVIGTNGEKLSLKVTVKHDLIFDHGAKCDVCRECSPALALKPIMKAANWDCKIQNAIGLMERICDLEWHDEQDPGAGHGLDRWIVDVWNEMREIGEQIGLKINHEKQLRPESKYAIDTPEEEFLRHSHVSFRDNLFKYNDVDEMLAAHEGKPDNQGIIQAAIKMGWHLPHPEYRSTDKQNAQIEQG